MTNSSSLCQVLNVGEVLSVLIECPVEKGLRVRRQEYLVTPELELEQGSCYIWVAS